MVIYEYQDFQCHHVILHTRSIAKIEKMDFVRKISSVTHQKVILMLSCVGQGALRTKNSYL